MNRLVAPSSAEQAALLLIEARRTGTPIDDLPPHLQPSSQQDAHRIQNAMIDHYGPVGGWKTAAGGGPEPFLSPLPESLITHQGLRLFPTRLPVVLVELEVALMLNRDLPALGQPYDADAVRPAIASFHPLLELITFSWTDRDKVKRLTQLADFQNSAGFVIGDAREDWHCFDPAGAACRLLLDDVEMAGDQPGAGLPSILDTLAHLANHAIARGMPLCRGQVVTTGARLIADASDVQMVRGEIEGLGSVYVSLA